MNFFYDALFLRIKYQRDESDEHKKYLIHHVVCMIERRCKGGCIWVGCTRLAQHPRDWDRLGCYTKEEGMSEVRTVPIVIKFQLVIKS